MSGSPSLDKIPVTVVAAGAPARLHWRRRAVQAAVLIIAMLIPLSGLLRIDPVAGAFVVLDRQIWWSDFFIIFGLWLMLASGLVLMYSSVGTAFCGWACPQNTLSELANRWTYKLLGRRADVSLAGEKMKIASAKNRLGNWLLLGLMILAAAMLFSLIPLLYFYPPDVVWSFITLRPDERLASSLHYIYTIFVIIFFVDIAFIRHFWCRFMCVYKVWQHGFKTRQSLHVAYDKARTASCEKCNYCVSSCFLGIDPRDTNMYDSCINCGECIDACNDLQAKKGEAGLLRFSLGEREQNRSGWLLGRLGSLSARMKWTLPFSLLGLGMFVWGLVNYEYYRLAVYRADTEFGSSIEDYRIRVSNKLYQDAVLTVNIEGLPKGSYALSAREAAFDSAGKIDLILHINNTLPQGLHRFLVQVQSADGWQDSYRVQHFVGKGRG